MKELSASKNQCEMYGIFSFFTGAGFLDLGFEDAGGEAEAVGVSDCLDIRNRQ